MFVWPMVIMDGYSMFLKCLFMFGDSWMGSGKM